MRRRVFLKTVCANLAGTLLPAVTQQRDVPRIGFLSSRSPDESAIHTAAFLKGLNAGGRTEPNNVAITYRYARGHYDKLQALAEELKEVGVALILAAGGQPSALAAKRVTSEIPVVFVIGDDPVRAGLVTSLSHPGGNITGVNIESSMLGGKRLELLCELVPDAKVVAVLANRNSPNGDEHIADVRKAAQILMRRLVVASASTDAQIESAFEQLAAEAARGVVVHNDPFFDSRRDLLIRLASKHSLPAIYHIREVPAAGGLASYGPSLTEAYRIAGGYAARILGGTKPADLPVQEPTTFELVVNARTAKALGIVLPPAIVNRADEIVE